MGIKNNHPYGVLMSFRDLQHETILEVMEQNNDKVSQEMKKGILNQLHQYDADKVLNFVIEVLQKIPKFAIQRAKGNIDVRF
jgi:ATP-dependent Clp protease adapter protein ClpS